ncbi:MAG: class I SAM-dependent methyltransferase [Janthinobacterium lividum]
MQKTNLDKKTIEDFGTQWTKYSYTDGFFGSKDLLSDFIVPFNPDLFSDKVIADIGAGTGRFTLNLLEFGASHVYALEPSKAVNVLKEKIRPYSNQVTIINNTGDFLPHDLNLDYAISIGVIHHISSPLPVIDSVYAALKEKGKFVIWLYGKEGNYLYLCIVTPIRYICRYLPSFLISIISNMLNFVLYFYMKLCKVFSFFPLSQYLNSVMSKLSWKKRTIVIYDQLAPAYAKYYSYQDCLNLMKQSKFKKYDITHRKGYSWVIIAEK